MARLQAGDGLRRLLVNQKKAAKAVVSIEDKPQLVTKADLAELESRIIKWNLATMGILTGIWTAIGIALRIIRP